MTKPEIIPVTEEIVKRFYGNIPPKTLRAVAAVRDEEILGIAGIFSIGMGWMLFADFGDEIRSDKRTMVKAVNAIRKLIANIQMPVYAKPADIEGAETLIEHIGGVELWHG